MDFDLTDEQRLLRDSVERLLADRYGFEARTRHAASPEGWSREMWSAYAELGLLGLPFPERFGGFGGGPVETMIAMEAMGGALVLEPYFATVVLCGGLLRALGSEAQQAALIPGIAEGRSLLAFAHEERHSRNDLAAVSTTARRDGAAWRIDGAKSLVQHGDVADRLLVSARSAGGGRDRRGIGLFLVDAADPGVSRQAYPTQDARRAAEIGFTAAVAEPLGDPEGALDGIEAAVDAAVAALCAEAVGVMAAMHRLTVDYMKTRKQFGRAIGEFQALQHRAVDMYVAIELARSMAMYATMMADAPVAERAPAISGAKVQIGRSGRLVGQEAIQLHGGIGMTMEYQVGHYFKRMTMIDLAFGNADAQLVRLARLGGLLSAEAG
jgi:pimeloyl-CoA dehydrogenase small subunit